MEGKKTICRKFKFDAAHRLPNYQGEGSCHNLHGHCWHGEVEIGGEVDPVTGMIMDFSELKKVMSPIIDKLDHSFINDFISNPTAENILDYFLDRIKINVVRLRIYETEDSYAEWKS